MSDLEEDAPAPGGTSPYEWVVAGMGGLIITFVIGFMLWHGLFGPSGPPSLSIAQTETITVKDGYLVGVKVRNDGGETASEVRIRGELLDERSIVESSGATLDYVPEGSEVGAYLQFTRDPRKHDLAVRVEGMTTP